MIFTRDCVSWKSLATHIATLMGPTWGPPGSCRPQMGPMNLAVGVVQKYLPWQSTYISLHFTSVHSLCLVAMFFRWIKDTCDGSVFVSAKSDQQSIFVCFMPCVMLYFETPICRTCLGLKFIYCGFLLYLIMSIYIYIYIYTYSRERDRQTDRERERKTLAPEVHVDCRYLGDG